VARLIHLNGSPGAGKSTVARLYAARHPGVLNLDIDEVTAMISGWQDDVSAAFELSRLMAAAMARSYLEQGGDVIMPQLFTNAREMGDFPAAAVAAGARYCQVVLAVDPVTALARLRCRAETGTGCDRLLGEHIERLGAGALVERVSGQLAGFLPSTDVQATIDAATLTPDQVCAALERLLSPASHQGKQSM
jgi:predicted kinase